MSNFETIESIDLTSVNGGTYRQGQSQIAAGQAEMDRSLAAAEDHAKTVGHAQSLATRNADQATGRGWGEKIGGAIGSGLGYAAGAVHGFGTGLAARLRTFASDINQ